MAHPRFMISRSSDNQFTFNLTAANAAIILVSQRYNSHSAAVAGARSVQAHASEDGQYECRVSVDQRPYFVLKSRNGEIIGTSQMYASESSREAGIESVKANALAAGVEG